jgi:hypothetical protein
MTGIIWTGKRHVRGSDGTERAPYYEVTGPHRDLDRRWTLLWWEYGYTGIPDHLRDADGCGQVQHGGLTLHASKAEAMLAAEAHNVLHERRLTDMSIAEGLVALLGISIEEALALQDIGEWNPDDDQDDPRGASTG